jgi:hypothetical protein
MATVIPNAEQTKSAISWLVTTFGAGIAGFIAGKGWATQEQVMAIINSPNFVPMATSAVTTLLPLAWGIYVHTKKYATEVVDAIPEVKGVVTDSSPAGVALAKSIPSTTVTTEGTKSAASVAGVPSGPLTRPGQN